jgi:hypothetical protein
MWLKKCLVLLVKKRRRILDAEIPNVEVGLHHGSASTQLDLHVNNSRWRYRKDGYEYDE